MAEKEIQEQNEGYETRLVELQNIAQYEVENLVLRTQKNKHVEKINELIKNCAEYERDNKALNKKCAEYERDNKELNKKCEDHERDNKELNKKCEDHKSDILALHTQNKEVKKMYEFKISEQNSKLEKYFLKHCKALEYESEIAKLKKKVEDLKTKVKAEKVHQDIVENYGFGSSFEKEEKKTIKEETIVQLNNFMCKKCSTNLKSGYMLDCGHLPFCDNCSITITNENDPKCPICSKSVAYRLRALIEAIQT